VGGDKNSPFLDTLRRLLRDRWKRLAKHTRRVLASDAAEPVHNLRITTRRLQELVVLAGAARGYPAIAPTLKTLRRVRRACSQVRNADVLLGHLASRLHRKGGEAELWSPLAEDLGAQRAKAQSKMRKALGKLDVADAHGRWQRTLRRSPRANADTEARVRSELQGHLRQRHEQFLAARDAALAQGSGTPEIHALRIAGKRLRYALEALDDLNGDAVKPALAKLQRFQAALGQWHDLEMMAELIITHCGRKKFIRRQPADALKLLQTLQRLRATQARRAAGALGVAERLEALEDVFSETEGAAQG
jgi:CHAD domain-containing protein